MAMDIDNLGGHVGEVLRETREFEDPWGWGIKGEVLRGDHPDWRQYDLELAADKPTAQKIRMATAETVFADLAPQGFRAKKKVSKGEAYDRMLRKVAEREAVTIDIFDLREKKEGIARILLKGLSFQGETVVRRGGVEYDLATPEGRLSFLNHEIWEFEEDGQTKTNAVPVYKRGEDGQIETDSYGEPVENILAGWNIGDAIAQYAVQESKDLAAFVDQRKGVILDRSGDTSSGFTGTGSPSQPQNDE